MYGLSCSVTEKRRIMRKEGAKGKMRKEFMKISIEKAGKGGRPLRLTFIPVPGNTFQYHRASHLLPGLRLPCSKSHHLLHIPYLVLLLQDF